jgi:hypothetical protein
LAAPVFTALFGNFMAQPVNLWLSKGSLFGYLVNGEQRSGIPPHPEAIGLL